MGMPQPGQLGKTLTGFIAAIKIKATPETIRQNSTAALAESSLRKTLSFPAMR